MDIERELAEIKEDFNRIFETRIQSSVSMKKVEYMDNYTKIYLLCKFSDANAAKLYSCYEDVLNAYLTVSVMPTLRRHHGASLLSELFEHWDIYKRVVINISRGAFGYLDRAYLPRSSLPLLKDVGAMCFKRTVFEELQRKVTETMLSLIERERKDEAPVDRALMKSIAVDFFLEMGIGKMCCYEEDFEAAMLDATSEFYSHKAGSWMKVMSSTEYLFEAETALQKEMIRAQHYLHPSSEPKVVEKVRQELLRVPATRLFEDEELGFRALIRANEKGYVDRIFRLYRELPEELQQVAELFQQHVREEVKGLVQAGDKASTDVIKKLVGLHDKYYRTYLNDVFEKHEFFHKALMEAFKEEFGTKPVATMTNAELIAIYCDEILRKGRQSENMREEDVDRTLESTVLLLTYVQDKDMFHELYRKKLAHRLLFGHSANIEHEKTILAHMNQRFGVEFSSKLEGMVHDVTMTEANNKKFEKFVSQDPLLLGYGPVDLSVTVMKINNWPTYKSSNIKMPDEMERSAQSYTKFFKAQNRDKKLTWLHTLGSCNVEAEFEAKTIELVVSTYQAIILSLFNSVDTLSYYDIKARINVNDNDEDEEELLRTLHSLSCAKYKILLKKPESNNASKDDVFEFNAKFTDPMPLIKVPVPIAAEEKERKKAARAVDNDRRYAVDCAIVRIMKFHKVLAHRSLMTECVEILSPNFTPSLNLVKRRIADLIDTDFIQRDEKDSTILHYIP